jgi:phosphoribosyl-AMP cyclohydrolase
MSFLDEVKFDTKGLVAAIIQDHENGQVLMLGYMNRDTLRQTIEGDRPVFWSRSRREVWIKGETSGHTQKTKEILYDCDIDAILIKVEQIGPACHTNHRSCFYRRIRKDFTTIEIMPVADEQD